MREGTNPFKIKNTVVPPASITICTLVCIPEIVGYFAGSLEALKLSLASIRAHTDQTFDLIVFDNGSCREVVDFLLDELRAQRIDTLILNGRNIGKPNAQRQMLRFAPGDVIVYADSDVYFRPGWLQAELRIMHAFPNVGEVGGQPVRAVTHFHNARSHRWAAEGGAQLEVGDLIPESYSRDYARSFGLDYAEASKRWSAIQDHRVTLNQVSAFLGVAHQQFLISREAILAIPYERFDNAIIKGDDQLNQTLDDAGFLQLSTTEPFVYHIGNAITEDWLRAEYERLLGSEAPPPPKIMQHWLWSRHRPRQLLKRLWRWSFELYYRYGS
jgi:glycosyltransferase involved in cell wall biosynthesis